jgi:4-carboxymuconolactone decarboxylase
MLSLKIRALVYLVHRGKNQNAAHNAAQNRRKAMPRIPLVTGESLTPEQKPVYEAIVGNANRGGRLPAPYKIALHSPRFARILQDMGGMMRYETVLPKRISELAIIITGRYWNCQTEWVAHAPIAIQNGLSEQVAEAIRTGKRPRFDQPDEEATYDYCTELHQKKFVSAATHSKTLEIFGIQGMLELTGLIGYYTTVAMLLNSQEYELAPGVTPPLQPLDQ